MVVWFTGMSGSGKSTLSKKLVKDLKQREKNIWHLDGDEIRSKVDYKNDFSNQSIKKNSLRIIELCNENINLYDYIIVSIIAPFEETRKYARKILGDNYKEIYVKTSLNELISRDTKGLYKKALSGELKNLIGLDPKTPYEIPENPNLTIDTDIETEHQSFNKIQTLIYEKK